MMSKFSFISLILVVVGSSAAFALTAESDTSVGDPEENILSVLRSARPDLEFGNVSPSPIEGYYEVSIDNRQTVYVSADGKHFFSGELYFAEPGKFVNATEMARSAQRKQELDQVPVSEMIVYSPEGETKAVMSVFTDVTCGYCRKLHAQMDEMNALGIEVRYLGYPRTGLERDGQITTSYAETSKAWCAEDRLTTMDQLKGGQQVAVSSCDENPLQSHFDLGQRFGVSGTPAIVMPDGTLLPGYRSPEAYAELLGIQLN